MDNILKHSLFLSQWIALFDVHVDQSSFVFKAHVAYVLLDS